VAATPRFRIEWTTDVGTLAAIEPKLTDVVAHAAELAAGYNEPQNARLMGHSEPLSEMEVVEHYTSLWAEGAHAFLLYVDSQLVGDADLRGIRGGVAEFAFMIGRPARQRRGLGTKFAVMVHACGFARLGLERVYVSIVPKNQASRRVFEKLGYKVDEGTEARAFADEAEDLTMVIKHIDFERLWTPMLAEIRTAVQ